MILTLACGKYRFNKLDFGDIGGIPRLLDIGQCNDAYSAIQIAVALAGAFECGVNDLPLSMVLSWYEQKAVAILLTLLHLGIKNIKLGPTLPAFITPNVLNFLVENFNIGPITTAEADLKAILGKRYNCSVGSMNASRITAGRSLFGPAEQVIYVKGTLVIASPKQGQACRSLQAETSISVSSSS